jgi:hypothetical protein
VTGHFFSPRPLGSRARSGDPPRRDGGEGRCRDADGCGSGAVRRGGLGRHGAAGQALSGWPRVKNSGWVRSHLAPVVRGGVDQPPPAARQLQPSRPAAAPLFTARVASACELQ